MYFWHTGILTHDIDKTINNFCSLPGVTRDNWTIMELEFNKTLVGAGGKLKAAFARIGGSVFELLQPLDTVSFHAAQLNKKGPGQHHTAYVCPDGMDSVINSLLRAGGRIVWETKQDNEHACYVETMDGGIIYELINRCPFMPE